MNIEETSAIILAGGRSSRMGTDKAKLRVGEKTLLELTAEKLLGLGIPEVVVSGCPECPAGTRYAPDLIPGKGPLSGIHAGLGQIRSRAGLVLPVDMPLVPEETLRLLIGAHGRLPITALTLEGRLEPLVAVYDACLAGDCERILRGEKTSPRRLFDLYGYLPVPYTRDPGFLINCNTPEEFELVRKAEALRRRAKKIKCRAKRRRGWLMNKRERVIASFHGQETDHVPVCMWKHVPQKYWADDDAFAAHQAASYRNTDVDFMKLSGDGYFGWPHPLLETADSVKELYRLEPLGAEHPYVRGQIQRTGKVVRALGGECVALYLVFVPLSCLRLRIGYPKMMQWIREDPEAVKYACEVIAEDLRPLVRGLIQDAGVDGIFYSVQNGEENRFTAGEYRDWVAPSDRIVLDYANSLSDMNAIHFCAWEEVPNRLSVWADYKAPVISWSRYMDIMDIREAQKRFGCTVWGGFDNRPGSLLYTASREEIERETASLIAQGGKRGYILGADCSLHDELEEERIRWVAEAARKI